jgi:hypothetical protein
MTLIVETTAMSSIYIGGKIIAEILEKDLILKSTSLTTGKIMNLLANFIYGGEKNIEDLISKLDIKHKLEVIESYLSNLSENNYTKTTIIAMHGVSEMITQIHTNLDNIQNKIIEHKKRYFYWLYSANVYDDLQNLEQSVKNLDNRFSLFMKIKA